MEQWRDLPGYEGMYRVSDQGNVWSVRASKRLAAYMGSLGYLRVGLVGEEGADRKRYRHVHQLVALAFLGPRGELVCDHINADKTDNRLANLRYITHRENTLRGTSPHGMNSQRTHCPKGHPYEGRNLLRKPGGARNCRACEGVRVRDWKRRQRAKVSN